MSVTMDKKERIIEAATTSFTQYGFKGTTMDSVAKLAKVGKGTIYTFFKNKEELFREIVKEALLDLMAVANRAIESGRPFHENIQAILEAIMERKQSHQFIIKVAQEARDLQTLEVIEMLTVIERAIIDYIRNIIVKEMAKGEQMKQDPELLAFLLYHSYVLLISKWEHHHAPLTKEQISEVLKKQIG